MSIRYRAFTLIELLVSIAVIAILGLIVISATAKIRGRMDEATCALNLRGIGIAISMYVNENNGRLPGPVNRGQTAVTGLGSNSLLHHIGSYMDVVADDGNIRNYIPAAGCPAHAAAAASMLSQCWWLNQEAVVLTDTLRVNPWGHPNSTPEPGKPIQLQQIDKPEKQMVMQDCDMELPGASGWTGIPSYAVHGHTRNRLFFDWHVEAVSKDRGRDVFSR